MKKAGKGGGDGAEQEGGLDVVVIGDGDEGIEADFGDLAGFEIEGELGGEGRSPEAAGPIDGEIMEFAGAALEALHEGANELVLRAPVGDEVEGLLGLIGVGVEGDAGLEAAGCGCITPEVGDGGVGHSRSCR